MSSRLVRDKSKWRNVRRNSTIPWLAEYIRAFNDKRTSKADSARARAALADHLMQESYPIRERL